MDDDNKDQLISADGESDGLGDDKAVVDPDLLDEMDDAELEDDLEEDTVESASDDDDEEDDEGYGFDTNEQ